MAKEQKQTTGSYVDILVAGQQAEQEYQEMAKKFKEETGYYPEENPHEQDIQAEQEAKEAMELVEKDHIRELTIFIPLNATVEERLMFMSYLGDSEPLWNYPGEILTIVGVAAFDDWKRDKEGELVYGEDGELIPCKRTVWKGQLGKLWHSTSNVAYGWCKRSLWPVMTLDNKPGNLVAPIKIKIGIRPTRSGNNTFKFDIVSE